MSFLSNTEKGGIRKKISSISFKRKSRKVDFITDEIENNLNKVNHKNDKIYEDVEDKYHYIKDFDSTDETVCIRYDKKNQEIYDKNVKFYTECKQYLKNKRANFSINESPKPPRKPSNHQLYLDYKKRNVKHNCIDQSLAVIYLLNKGYKLIKENNGYETEKQMTDDYCFEAYMAIGLAEILSQNHGEDYKNKNLSNNYYVLNNYNVVNNYVKNLNCNSLPPYIENSNVISNDNDVEDNGNNNIENVLNPKPSAPPASHAIQYNNLLNSLNN
jgi:hypothetical protein